MKQDILNLSFGYHCKIYYCVLHKPQDIEVTEPFKIYVLNIKGKKNHAGRWHCAKHEPHRISANQVRVCFLRQNRRNQILISLKSKISNNP